MPRLHAQHGNAAGVRDIEGALAQGSGRHHQDALAARGHHQLLAEGILVAWKLRGGGHVQSAWAWAGAGRDRIWGPDRASSLGGWLVALHRGDVVIRRRPARPGGCGLPVQQAVGVLAPGKNDQAHAKQAHHQHQNSQHNNGSCGAGPICRLYQARCAGAGCSATELPALLEKPGIPGPARAMPFLGGRSRGGVAPLGDPLRALQP
mmetsp:Transcript_106628/g.301601  ORF Transcript_106628/g.301601 Transcript_106628/m.301601 type:complete len:206 (-) Transcript_106628:442-1059(-)